MLTNLAERTVSLYTDFRLHKRFRVTKFVCLCKYNSSVLRRFSSQAPASVLTDQNDSALNSFSTPPKFPWIEKLLRNILQQIQAYQGTNHVTSGQIGLNSDEVT